MKKLNVYLSGCVKLIDEEFQGWRDTCLNQPYAVLNFIDPNRYFNYTNKLPKTNKQCQDLFMWQIEHSDILLVNLDHSNLSVGTGMEIEHAYCRNIPIIGFGKDESTWYGWAESRCSVVFDDLEDAICYIYDSYYTTYDSFNQLFN